MKKTSFADCVDTGAGGHGRGAALLLVLASKSRGQNAGTASSLSIKPPSQRVPPASHAPSSVTITASQPCAGPGRTAYRCGIPTLSHTATSRSVTFRSARQSWINRPPISLTSSAPSGMNRVSSKRARDFNNSKYKKSAQVAAVHLTRRIRRFSRFFATPAASSPIRNTVSGCLTALCPGVEHFQFRRTQP